jgi:hypothetical protein
VLTARNECGSWLWSADAAVNPCLKALKGYKQPSCFSCEITADLDHSILCVLLLKSKASGGLDLDESPTRKLEVLAHNCYKKVVAWFYEERNSSFTGLSSALLNFVNVKWERDFRTYEELEDSACADVVNLWQEKDSKAQRNHTIEAIRTTPIVCRLLACCQPCQSSRWLRSDVSLHPSQTGVLFLFDAHHFVFFSCSGRTSLNLAFAKSAKRLGRSEETTKNAHQRLLPALHHW